jgi:hypothetical protein
MMKKYFIAESNIKKEIICVDDNFDAEVLAFSDMHTNGWVLPQHKTGIYKTCQTRVAERVAKGEWAEISEEEAMAVVHRCNYGSGGMCQYYE